MTETTGRLNHPVAELFPMLAEDELAELAADIKARGQIQPIVLDAEGRILDGRNRFAACAIAGVEPEFTTYDGEDPDGYALAVNIARRHLTTGARAIIAAKAARLDGSTKSGTARELDINKNRLTEAGLVLDWAPDLAPAVVAGDRALSVALEEARQRKKSDEERQRQKARLHADASDLLSLVDEERMSLADAVAALDAREEKARQEAEERRTEKEQARRQREQERLDSLERDRGRLRMVVSGWPTMRNTILSDPGSHVATEIIDGLGEGDQLALKQIIQEIQGRGDDHDG